MTFRSILESNGFHRILETDFCNLMQKDDIQFIVFKNTGIRCIALSDFQEISVGQLRFIYEEKGSDLEEFEFTYSINEENLINFLFGLIPFEIDLGKEVPNPDYFGEKLMIKKDENLPAVLLSDKDGLSRNVLVFSENFYRPLFSNRDCCLFTDRGKKKLAIAYDPYRLLTFISKSESETCSTILFLENTSETFLEYPFEFNFESYSIICSTTPEYIEALRFLVKFINLAGFEHLCFSRGNGLVKLEFILNKETELLRYIQLLGSVQKSFREIYSDNEFIYQFNCKKGELLNSKTFTISFKECRQGLEILSEYLIGFYKAPIKFISL